MTVPQTLSYYYYYYYYYQTVGCETHDVEFELGTWLPCQCQQHYLRPGKTCTTHLDSVHSPSCSYLDHNNIVSSTKLLCSYIFNARNLHDKLAKCKTHFWITVSSSYLHVLPALSTQRCRSYSSKLEAIRKFKPLWRLNKFPASRRKLIYL